MKRLIIILLVLACGTCFAQNKKGTKTATINIPGYCCHGLDATIENTLAYEPGVTSWKLNKDGKCVVITYKEGKTTPDKVEKALAQNGVRVEHYKPNPKAISKLPKCCQPAARGECKGDCKE